MTTSTRAVPRSIAHPVVSRGHRNLLLATAILATVLVSLGSIVCATDSSSACPDWPGCFGKVVPPPNINAILEYTHRFFAALTGLLIIASAGVSWLRTRSVRAIAWTTIACIPLTVAVMLFGRAVVLTGLPRHLAILDLGSALLILTLMMVAAVVAFVRYATQSNLAPAAPPAPGRGARSTLARLGLAAAASLYVLYIIGIFTAGPGSLTRCVGWPMLAIISTDAAGWLQVVRLLLAGLAAILVLTIAWTVRRSRPRLTILLPFLLVLELALGLLIYARGSNFPLVMAYVTVATVLYATLVALAVHAIATAPQRAHS